MALPTPKLNIAELRRESFDPKRWVSMVLDQQLQAHPAGPSAAKVAAQDPKAVESSAALLGTALQLQAQEATATLDECITQALVRLPRANMELGRVGADAKALGEQLQSVDDRVESVRKDEAVSAQLHALHATRTRLVECRDTLHEARRLTAHVDSVQRRMAQPVTDQKEYAAIATEIAQMQAALHTLDNIDESFGEQLRSQVHGFEGRLQQALETDCVDALKHQDTAKAPALLATLRRIGRDQGVLEEYTRGVIAAKVQKLKTDLAAAPSSSKSEASVLKKQYHATVKALRKEEEYFLALYAGAREAEMEQELEGEEEGNGSADKPAAATAAPVASVDPVSEAAKTTDAILAAVLKEVDPDVARLLTNLDNPGLVAAYTSMTSELQPFVSRHGAGTANPELEAVVRRPFAAASTPFAEAEKAAVQVAVARATATSSGIAAVAAACDAIVQSAKQCAQFLPDATAPAAAAGWTLGLQTAADAVLAQLPACPSAADAGIGTALSEALALHADAGKLPPHRSQLEAQLAGALGAGHAAIAAVAPGLEAVDAVPTACKERALEILRAPGAAKVAEYCASPPWAASPHQVATAAPVSAASVAPSVAVRGVGEWLMELPLQLEVAGADADDVPAWLSGVVAWMATEYAAAAEGLLASAGPAEDQAMRQLSADVEYVGNVFGAVSDEPPHAILTALAEKVAGSATPVAASPTSAHP